MADLPFRVPGALGPIYALGGYYTYGRGRSRAASPLGRCLRDFKDRGDRYAGRSLARLFAERFHPLVESGSVVVPIPSDPLQLRRRLFHPAGWLAAALARRGRVPLVPAALRRRPGRPAQRTLSGADRRRNVREAFELGPASLRAHSVVLADDVLTTGATMQAATRCLLEGGVGRVQGVVLACADERAVQEWQSKTDSVGNADIRHRHA